MTKRQKHGRCLTLALVLALASAVCLTTAGYARQAKQVSTTAKPAGAKGMEVAPPVQMTIEPKAIDLIREACSRLAAARSMSFTAVVTYENPSRLGTPLAYTTKSQVIVQRPDKLTVLTYGDGPASEFYYDGKTMTAFAPGENLVAVAQAPPTIDETLQAAYDSAAIYFPFSDLIVADPYKDLSDGLILAFYIGQSKVVGGTTTDMVAYADNDVFVQAWIGADDKLPRMLRAVYRTDPARLRHQLELSNWQLNPTLPASAFGSTSAAEAKPIPFAHPQQTVRTGVKAPVQSKPTKTL